MANTVIKISQLANINGNLTSNTLLPVVSTNGTFVTDKVNVTNLANFILEGSGNAFSNVGLSSLAYNVINAAQPNITSVGTLSNLNVSGDSNLGDVSGLTILGGENGYFLQTNGDGVLNWSAAPGSGNGAPGGANTQIQFNDNGLFNGNPGLTFDQTTDTLGTVNFLASSATVYDNLYAGNLLVNANLTSENILANNFTVNSFSTGNISVTGNIEANYFIGNGSALTGVTATASGAGPNTAVQYNIDGITSGNSDFTYDEANYTLNVTNILATNLQVTATTTVNDINFTGNIQNGNLVSANYLSGDGSNITNVGNVNFANTSNVANTADVANSVAVANVVGIGNIATISLNGNASTVLYGNGVFAGFSVANANYASYANVATLANSVVVEAVNNNFSYHVVLTTGAGDTTLHNDIDDNFQYNPADGILTVTRVDATYVLANLHYANGYPANSVVGLGNVAFANFDGNNGNVLSGNGSWISAGGGIPTQIANGTSNVNIATANGPVTVKAGSSNTWTFGSDGVLSTAGNIAVNGGVAIGNSGNIISDIASMVVAPNINNNFDVITADGNSFYRWDFSATGNLTLPGNSLNIYYNNGSSAFGNIVGVNKDGSSSNVLYGNGAFAPIANANYATFAGEAYSVDGANVNGEVANANFAVHVDVQSTTNNYSYHVVLVQNPGDGHLQLDGDDQLQYNPNQGLLSTYRLDADIVVANLYYSTGYQASNIIGLGNVALSNFDGNASNVLYGNGVFAGITAGTSLVNGNSNVVVNANSNVIISTNGNASVMDIGADGRVRMLTGQKQIGGNIANSEGYIQFTTGSLTYFAGNIQLLGGGYIKGPAGTNVLQLNSPENSSLRVVGNLAVGASNTGNIYGGNAVLSGTTTTGVSALLVGPTFTPLANTMAGFVSNVNSYTQLTIQNKSTGADATTDFIATADNGSDTVNYLDMGIINSGYDANTPTNSLGNIVFAADSYMYAQGNTSNASQSGGNLAIGTSVPGKNVKIFAGGVDNTAIVANIANTGITITGNLSVSGNISGNTNGFAIGYLNIPQVSASNTTLALTDAGKHYYSTTAGNLTLTVPLNSSVAFPTGTAITIVVQAAGNVLVNAASGVTLYLAGNSTSANRVVGTYGMATLMKVATDTWFINGTGVS